MLKSFISSGSYGSVYIAELDRDYTKFFTKGKLCAVKLYRETFCVESTNDVNALLNMKSKYIMNGHPLLFNDFSYMLLMPLGDGNLSRLATLHNLTLDMKMNIIKQMVKAVYYIHSLDYCHLDIKLENFIYYNNYNEECDDITDENGKIFIDESFNRTYPDRVGSKVYYDENIRVKLTDMLTCISSNNKMPLNVRITHGYRPPENYDNYNINRYTYGKHSDIWSLGMCIIKFLTGDVDHGFMREDFGYNVIRYIQGEADPERLRARLNRLCDHKLIDVIIGMTDIDVNRRYTIDKVCEDLDIIPEIVSPAAPYHPVITNTTNINREIITILNNIKSKVFIDSSVYDTLINNLNILYGFYSDDMIGCNLNDIIFALYNIVMRTYITSHGFQNITELFAWPRVSNLEMKIYSLLKGRITNIILAEHNEKLAYRHI